MTKAEALAAMRETLRKIGSPVDEWDDEALLLRLSALVEPMKVMSGAMVQMFKATVKELGPALHALAEVAAAMEATETEAAEEADEDVRRDAE